MKQLKQSIVDYEPTTDRKILNAYTKKTDIPRRLLFCMLKHLPEERCSAAKALEIAAPWNHNEGVRTVAGLPPCWSGAEAPATNAQHTQPLEPATITAPAKPMVIEPAKQISVQDESFDLETLAVEEMQWKNGNVKLQSPRTSSQVKFLFNPRLVHPTSGLIGSSGHLLEDNQKQNYFHKWLKRGYIILEVAGLVWPLTEDEQEGVLSGLYNQDTDYIIVRYKK